MNHIFPAGKDFSFWRDLFQNDPERWITELLSPVSGAADNSAAIASWLDADELRRYVAESRDSATGALSGIPFAVKDLFDQSGFTTRASSGVLRRLGTEAHRNAGIVEAFSTLGCIPTGRTQMNEFAYGLDGMNRHTGNCPNPRDSRRISGGSSSGSAWAVGSDAVPLALGTDTGGSIRVPAALCGIFGFRRGVDHFATEGVFPLAPSFDTAGWFTGTLADMQETLALMVKTPAAGNVPTEDGASAASGTPRMLWYTPPAVPLSAEVVRAFERIISTLPVEGFPVSGTLADLPAEEGLHAYNVIGSTEAYAVHCDWLDTYRELYSPEVWALIDRARHWTEGETYAAYRMKERIKERLSEILEQYDAIVMPAVHRPAPFFADSDGEFRKNLLRLTSPASHAGLPVLTIPVPVSDGPDAMRPTVGLQCIMEETSVLSVTRYLSRED